MRSYDLARLLALAVIWSMQYIFMRVAVPVFGVALVAESRALFAALLLVPAALLAGQRIGPLANWRDHVSIGLANNVLPFACFAYSATALPAGYIAILSGTTPLWTALFAAWVLNEPLGARSAAGFVLGLAGVALIVNLGPVELDARTLLAAAAGLLGSAAWAGGGIMIKQRMGRVAPIGLAAGSIGFAAVLMAPFWASVPQASAWTLEASASLIALGTLCSGVAYLAFFTLVRDIGPSRTLSIGFMVPVLGVAWGWLLLDEAVTLPMLGGAALVLIAMALVLRR